MTGAHRRRLRGGGGGEGNAAAGTFSRAEADAFTLQHLSLRCHLFEQVKKPQLVLTDDKRSTENKHLAFFLFNHRKEQRSWIKSARESKGLLSSLHRFL